MAIEPDRPGTRETSATTIRLTLRYVQDRRGPQGVAEVLRRAGLPDDLAVRADDAGWFGYDERIRLFEAATAVVGDPRTMFHVGATALEHGISPGLVLLLRSLGSPQEVYRQLPRVLPKLTTTSVMETPRPAQDRVTVTSGLRPGYRPSRLNCLFAEGLLAAVPAVFGLPEARVEHHDCQADGAGACVYEVRWQPWSRLPWRRRRYAERAAEQELDALRRQLTALQSTAADLVGDEDLPTTLRRITERAASAVLAPAHVLALYPHGHERPTVQSAGLSPEQAEEVAARLLAGDDLGPGAVVVDVASTRHRHGRLAALYPEGHRGLEDEGQVLAAYARHAAAALDLVTALDASRREGSRAAALLDLARRLAAARELEEVADVVVQAMPRITGAQKAAVLLWSAEAGALQGIASYGLDADEERALFDTVLPAGDTPELVDMLTNQQPVLLRVSQTTPVLTRLLQETGTGTVVVAPLVVHDELLGVITSAWAEEGALVDPAETTARLTAVSDQAATALQNAQLLGTVRHQAAHDTLTGLANRELFTRRMETALLTADPARRTAVLFCDLDGFKRINDRFGHAAGDEVLRQVAARLAGCLRPSDLLGRLSGDQFAVLLTDLVDDESAVAVAHRLVESFGPGFRVEGSDVAVTCSVGVAVHEGTGGRGDLLLHSADAAMQEAKRRGRNQVGLASATQLVHPGTGGLEAEIARAAAEGQLILHVQPIIGLHEGMPLLGVEALMRWRHPRLGELLPGAFLPVAEEVGLVADLDMWAIDEACRTLAAWDPGGPTPAYVAVNLSAASLVDDRLLPTVRASLTRHGLRPERLHVEVVESRSLFDLARVQGRLVELRRLGVRVALDDFGTGYSTLAWLQRLPVDQLKIDRSFVRALGGDGDEARDAEKLVRGVLALAEEMRLDVVAEGVETAEQLAALQVAGCPGVQGYLLGRPAPAPDRHSHLNPAPDPTPR